eukprot:979712-Rhodomonas_salina.2
MPRNQTREPKLPVQVVRQNACFAFDFAALSGPCRTWLLAFLSQPGSSIRDLSTGHHVASYAFPVQHTA